MVGEVQEILLAENDDCVAIIIDTGATASVIGTDRAEKLSTWCRAVTFDNKGRSFRSASGTAMAVLSTGTFNFPFLGLTRMEVVDVESTPALLGADFLGDCNINLSSNQITKNGKTIQMKELPNGHRVILISKSRDKQAYPENVSGLGSGFGNSGATKVHKNF